MLATEAELQLLVGLLKIIALTISMCQHIFENIAYSPISGRTQNRSFNRWQAMDSIATKFPIITRPAPPLHCGERSNFWERISDESED
jgi:hypothetical protein